MLEKVTPGEILNEEFVKPLRLSDSEVTLATGVTLNELVQGSVAVDWHIALGLSILCNTTPEFWLDLQRNY